MSLRFHAPVFVVTYRDLIGAIGALYIAIVDNEGHRPVASVDVIQNQILDALDHLKVEDVRFPFSQPMVRKIERIRERIATDDRLSFIQAEVLLKELANDLLEELSSAYFLMIPATSRAFYEQRMPLFGTDVERVFPDAEGDIAAAGRCIALQEWTAAVFHLMRAVELGLQQMAASLGVPNVDRQDWAVLTERIESAIRDREGKGRNRRTADETEQLQAYSEAAVHLRHFRNAWRNHVAHARAHYDGREALAIFSATGAFMQKIADVSLMTPTDRSASSS
ncbi:MAG: hypothetical protein R3C39_03435 [Dehalococcoidia bacterium]